MCSESASSKDSKSDALFIGGIVLGGAIVLSKAVHIVPANHVGIVDVFGIVNEAPLRSGLHVVNPMAEVHVVSCKTELQDHVAVVPSKEGLNVEVHFAVQYHVDETNAVDLYKKVGLDYMPKLVQPQVKAAVRKATSTRDAKALYTSEREQIKLDLLNDLNQTLNPRGIVVEDVPLKHIEAKGISDFQQIVSNGIDDRLLRWKGIEATVDLAKSTNAKVVVVGQGKDGLPLILGGATGK